MKNTIRKKWIITTVVFTAVLLLITAVFLLPGTKQPAEDTAAERLWRSEVQQLIGREEDEQAALKLQALKEKMQAGQTNEAAPSKKGTAVYLCYCFFILLQVMGYLYYPDSAPV